MREPKFFGMSVMLVRRRDTFCALGQKFRLNYTALISALLSVPPP